MLLCGAAEKTSTDFNMITTCPAKCVCKVIQRSLINKLIFNRRLFMYSHRKEGLAVKLSNWSSGNRGLESDGL